MGQLIFPTSKEMSKLTNNILGDDDEAYITEFKPSDLENETDDENDTSKVEVKPDESGNQKDLVENTSEETAKVKGLTSNSGALTTECSKCIEPYWRCEKGECIRESVFKFNQHEIFGIFLIVILIALMTAAGVGGEVILIPIIKVFFSFNSIHSIAL